MNNDDLFDEISKSMDLEDIELKEDDKVITIEDNVDDHTSLKNNRYVDQEQTQTIKSLNERVSQELSN